MKYPLLTSAILKFLEDKKIAMKIKEIDDSKFWLDSLDGFISVKFVINESEHLLLYDVFSPKLDTRLKVESLRDVEMLDTIAEEKGRWKYEKSIEELWLTLDWIKLWAQENGFNLKETHLI